MKADDLQEGQRFVTRHAPEVFTRAKRPIERVGGLLLIWVDERPGHAMSLMVGEQVTLVP